MYSEYQKMTATAKNRRALAAQLEALAAEVGATVERTDRPKSRNIYITMTRGWFAVSTWIDALPGMDAFLGHWHTVPGAPAEARYPDNFPGCGFGMVNPHHHAKATAASETWAGFVEMVRRGWSALPSAPVTRESPAYSIEPAECGSLVDIKV